MFVCDFYNNNKHNFQFIAITWGTNNKVDFLLKTKYRSHGERVLKGGLSTPVTRSFHYLSKLLIWRKIFKTKINIEQSKTGERFVANL